MVKTGHQPGRLDRRHKWGVAKAVRTLAVFCRATVAVTALSTTTAMFYAGLPMAAAIAKDGGRGGGDHDGGDGGDHDGSGHDGGDDHGGGEDGGKGRGGGDDDARGQDGDVGKGHGRSVGRYLDALKNRGRVVWSSAENGALEVRYADGWSERVKGSTYSLLDPARRNVVSRPARKSDMARLRAAIP